jgi:tetratricopeptide (TPR) repeat protein
MTKTGSVGDFGGDVAEQRFAELYDKHKQHLAWVGVVILAIGAGAWFYARSESIKTERAQAAFQSAIQSVASGNLPLAQSDLKKAATRYAGTDGGTESSMALAKIYYQQGKYQDGISALSSAAADKGDLQFEARLLVAAGYEGLAKWPQAAKAYEDASAVARFDADKKSSNAMAARAYQAGGDKAAASKLWNGLLSDPKGTFATEANIRLGEMEAVPTKS